MKKPIQNPTAKVATVVDVSPQILREFADRLDQAAKVARVKHGSNVLVDFTDEITFRFNPEVPLSKMMNGFTDTEVVQHLDFVEEK
jgi:hypothetical protein